jgi:two-component system, OmpR family, response regulator NblR
MNSALTTVISPNSVLVAHGAIAQAQEMEEDLRGAGYRSFLASSLERTMQVYHESHPALVVVDYHLNGGGGLRCCRALRDLGATIPLLLLMTQDILSVRIACLDSGADDYILQPPYQRETFLQRVRLYLNPAPALELDQLRFDDLTLNLLTRSAQRGDRPIDLTMKEYELLKFLMEHPREVLSREQILENVWGYDFVGESNVIEVYVRYLRLKVEEDGEKRLIHTVRGVGYVLRDA